MNHATWSLLAVAFFGLSFLVPLEGEEPAPPNIVVFLVDDLGVMDTSVPFLMDASGEPRRYPLNDFYRTPSMEKLAERGIRFSQFYAMSVCSPSRISLLTGQNAARHGTTNWINPWENNAGPLGPPDWNWEGLGKNDVTLPALLQARGYRTIHIGKGHFGPENSEGADPANLGFDVNIAGSSIGAPGSYYGAENYGHGTKRAKSAVPHLEEYHGTETFLTEALTIEAQREIAEAVETGTPFFLYLSHYAVHSPFESDPRFADHYKDSGRPAPARNFATLIEGMDKSLGDMLDQIEKLGVAENTLIFFLGDNGSDAPLGHQHTVASAAPLRGKKGSHYEGGMRVPFIAAWAEANPEQTWQQRLPVAAGAVQPQVANITDVFSTLTRLLDLDVPARHITDGAPLETLLTAQPDPSRPEQFLMHYPHAPHRSNYFTVWRDGDWKLIHHMHPTVPTTGGRIQFEDGHFELFHLATDPFEQNNLARQAPEILERMMQTMEEQLDAAGALRPVGQATE